MNVVRPQVLVVEPCFGDFGGAQVVLMWMLEALKQDFEVCLFSWNPLDIARGNRLAGTTISPQDFTPLRPECWIRGLGNLLKKIDRDPWSILPWAVMTRRLRCLAPTFAAALSCADETDFGCVGIQYIHYPYLEGHFFSEGRPAWRPGRYWRPWRLLGGFDLERMRANTTLTNSMWTAGRIAEAYSIDAEVIYPPVPGDFPHRAWEDRDDCLVCVGRISSDKRLPIIVETVRQLRRDIPNLRLRILGVAELNVVGSEEIPRIQRLAQEFDWIDLHFNVSRSELIDLLASSKLAMHAKREEHFGIAVAEMAQAGCALLVHNSGGQVEIVGQDPELLYTSVPDAASKFLRIWNDSQHRQQTLHRLSLHSQRFSSRHFQERLKAVLTGFIAQRNS